MVPEQICQHPPSRLTEAERAQYFDQGFLCLPEAISASWIARLQTAMGEMIERSRHLTVSDTIFELEDSHTADRPRLHRLYSPQDHHQTFWEFMVSDEMTSFAADVVGPDVKFHHAKLNFKSGRGSRGFKWHQDIQAWPHTDFSPVTIGIYIEGCNADQGPMAMLPGSHRGPLYSMYDESGHFVVRISERETERLALHRLEAPTGPPGTAVFLNCCTVHGSVVNRSDTSRPLLLMVYSSADSFSYTASPIASPRLGEIVRGRPARYACFDPRPCELPPDWARHGYHGPWQRQKAEEQREQS